MSRHVWRTAFALVTGIAVAFTVERLRANEPPPSPWQRGTSPGLDALATASANGRYAFVLFWREQDEATQRMQATLEAEVPSLPTAADVVTVCVADDRETAMVELFGVARAPLPLIAAVAPNGAVTKAWPLKVASTQLAEGLVSRGTAECLKAMQARKLTVLCVQNSQAPECLAVRQAVMGFQADERFREATTVVVIDPAEESEHAFLASLKVEPELTQTVTLLLSPAGQPVGQFRGTMTTEQIVAKVVSAQAGCCPGGQCGPGGCCPGGKCGPPK